MSNTNKLARVVLIANSQGTSAGVHWKDTYPTVLTGLLGSDIELHRLILSGWTIRDFIGVIEDNIIGLRPDLVVIQIGIVECARRILSNKQKALFQIVPFGRKITKYLHNHRASILKIRNWLGINVRLIDALEFEILIARTVKIFEEYHVPYIFVPIPYMIDNGLSLKHPMINQDIKEYNAILYKFFTAPMNYDHIHPHNVIFQTESVHFTVDGHKIFAGYLAEVILSNLSDSIVNSLSILER